MSFAALVAQPLQQPFSVFQDDAGAYISPVGIDFTAPKEKNGIYMGDGSLLFENDSRTHFAFHYGLADAQYTHDFETNWVTLWSEGVTNHQCGVVTSNYISIISWEHTTNRIAWKQTKLELKEPPQRVTNSPANGWNVISNMTITNMTVPWYYIYSNNMILTSPASVNVDGGPISGGGSNDTHITSIFNK
jgi:hypothetical protein